jgi:sporulation protein YlmC with PRC-barrel domain
MKILAPFATSVAAVALLTAGAIAQTTPATPPTQTPPAATTPSQAPAANAVTQQSANQWRASQLMGLDVYNDKDEKVGDIIELITDKSGKIEAVVVGVGGFLGMGRHDVALRWQDLRFVNEPRRTASTPPATNTNSKNNPDNANRPTTTPTATTNTTREGPDHAVISLTRDQLKAMPAFKYASDRS